MKIFFLFFGIVLNTHFVSATETGPVLIRCSKGKFKLEIIRDKKWNTYFSAKYPSDKMEVSLFLQDSPVFTEGRAGEPISWRQSKNAEFFITTESNSVVAVGFDEKYPETQVSLIGDHFQSQNQQLRFVGKFSGPGLKNEVQLNCVAKK